MYWFEIEPLRYRWQVLKQASGNYKSYDWVIDKETGYIRVPSFLNRPEVEKLINGNSCWFHHLYIQHQDPITHKDKGDLWIHFNCSQIFTSCDIENCITVPIFKDAEYFEEARMECFRIIEGLISMEKVLHHPDPQEEAMRNIKRLLREIERSKKEFSYFGCRAYPLKHRHSNLRRKNKWK